MQISVFGCGRWGSFLAWYADKLGHDVMLWGRTDSEKFNELRKTRKNSYLVLPDKVVLSSDLEECIGFGEFLIVSISSQGLRQFAASLKNRILKGKKFILCMKGLEQDTGKRLSQILAEETFQKIDSAIWVGPGHVQDFTAGIPNCMVIDSGSLDLTKEIVTAFNSDLIRMYYGDDLIGNEIGAAAKNVMGIAAGMLDGFGYASLKGALMARGAREVSRLIKAAGGSEMTAYGLGHLGDYEATLFSHHSHNRMYGETFIRGGRYNELAEGISTARALMVLSEKYKTELPISEGIYRVIHEGKDPRTALTEMFLRPVRSEFA